MLNGVRERQRDASMKLYITGSVGSGKSTLARRIGALTGVGCVHLDDIMYEPDPSDPGDNRKRDPALRDRMFSGIISSESWVIEDAGRACFAEGMRAADTVVILNPPRLKLYFRVVRRWIRQRLGREKSGYRPDLVMLKLMVRWVGEYDISRFAEYVPKAVYLRTHAQTERYISTLAKNQAASR